MMGLRTDSGRKLSLQEKLHILADAAKYDVACTSSGAERRGKKGYLGNSRPEGICHSFAADGRCISLLKILMTNHCVFDCKYCINRCSNDVERTAFTPEEICRLTVEFYRRNYIEGLFLSSGVLRSPAYTMERMCETLQLLRGRYRFNGYIHVKAIPGAPDELLSMAGYLADRVSINLELPTEDSLRRLAPHKSFQTILSPMRKFSDAIADYRLAVGQSARLERSALNEWLPGSIFSKKGNGRARVAADDSSQSSSGLPAGQLDLSAGGSGPPAGQLDLSQGGSGSPAACSGGRLPIVRTPGAQRPFAPAGQSTQMIIGASGESDYQLLCTTQQLYRRYDLKRVFYSAYIPLNEDCNLPAPGTAVPLLREHRLYQADWLLRFYGFRAEELLSPQQPNFHQQIDPKCDWALRHLEQFPVEVQTAPMDVLLRVPGIGPKSVRRIVAARRHGCLDFSDLKKMGVVLKRAHYFITCGGRMMYRIPVERQFIMRQLTDLNGRENWQIEEQSRHRQMSLFADFQLA